MKKWMVGLWVVGGLWLGIDAPGAKVPDGAIFFPDRPSFGINCHTYFNGKDLTAIGAGWVRVDLSWAGIEKTVRGQYDFSHYEKVVDGYRACGLKILAVLTNGDPSSFYPKPKDNFAAAVEGFCGYAEACARHFKGRIDLFELGNEPECFTMDNVYNQPEKYTEMAVKAARAIRKADSQVHVGALSVAWMDRPFVTRCFELGLLKEGTIDVVTFHGYHRATLLPESGLKEDVAWLRGQVRKFTPAGKKIIVIDSERGYGLMDFLAPKHWANWRNFVYTESEQAAYLARHYLEEISLGLEVSIWYKDMFGETGYSLYEGGPGSRIRPMGYVMRNLAGLFDTNPKQMMNHRYEVSLVDLPDDISDPNSFIKVKSALRVYVKENQPDRERLIIALWNPVEAFDGKILHSRQRIGENFYEAWRAISPEDKVEIPVQIRVNDLKKEKVTACYAYHLLAREAKTLTAPVKFRPENTSILTDTFKVGPFPSIIVIEIKK